jgi:tetratricopeptide (TPR) repeat protein
MDNTIDISDFRLGVEAFNNQEYDKAISHFSAQLLSPFTIVYYESLMGRGFSFYYQDNYLRAISDLTLAEEKITDNSELYLIKGLCHAKINDYNTAIHYFRKSVKVDDDNITSHYELYEALKVCNADTEALEVLNTIIVKGKLQVVIDRAIRNYNENFYPIAEKIFSDILKFNP